MNLFTSIYEGELSQMKTLNVFYLLIYWTQEVHNDLFFYVVPISFYFIHYYAMIFMNFLVHSYTCCSDRHASPHWTFIRRWILMGFNPSVLKIRVTGRCSSLAYVASGDASFTLLLRRRVAYLHRTATCRPLVKPSVSLLSTYKTIEMCFEFLSQF